MKTGMDAKRSGVYASECCLIEAAFDEEQTFTRCPKCHALTTWELVETDLPKAA